MLCLIYKIYIASTIAPQSSQSNVVYINLAAWFTQQQPHYRGVRKGGGEPESCMWFRFEASLSPALKCIIGWVENIYTDFRICEFWLFSSCISARKLYNYTLLSLHIKQHLGVYVCVECLKYIQCLWIAIVQQPK